MGRTATGEDEVRYTPKGWSLEQVTTYWRELSDAVRPGMIRESDGTWYAVRNINYPDTLRPIGSGAVRKLCGSSMACMTRLSDDVYTFDLPVFLQEEEAKAEAARIARAQLESEAALRRQRALAYKAEEERLEADAARKRRDKVKKTAIVGGAAAAGIALGVAATRRPTCGDCSDTPYRPSCGDCSDTPYRPSCDSSCDSSWSSSSSCDSSCDSSSCDFSGGGGDSSW